MCHSLALLLGFKLREIDVHLVETSGPETAIARQPVVDGLERPARRGAMQEVDLACDRYGSTADVASCLDFVRLTPESGQTGDIAECLLCAKSGHMQCSNRMPPS